MIYGLDPYPDTKNTDIPWFQSVPTHWKTKSIKRLARKGYRNFIDGDWIESPYITPDGIRLIQTGNVGTGKYREQGFRYISEKTFEEFNCTEIEPDDILICRLGEPVARACLAPRLGKRMITSVDVCILKVNENSCPRFLVYCMSCKEYLDWVGSLVRGSTRDRVSRSMLGSFKVPNPPISDQRAIARFLDDVDRRIQYYIDAKQKLIALLEEQKQAIVDQAVTGRIDVGTGVPYRTYKDGGTRWLKRVPKHWTIRRAKWNFREVDERSESGTEELLSVSHITGVTPRKEKNVTMFMAESNIGDKLCQPGDVVVNTMWAWMAALGVATQTGIISPSYAVYRPHGHSKLLPGYTELLLRSTPYKSEYNCQSTGIRASRLRLYPEQFLRMRLLCPPVDEQRTIIEFAEKTTETIRRSMDVTRRQLSRIQEFRTRIIAEVVTGKVDVRTAPASRSEDDFDDTKGQRDDGLRNDATAYPNEGNAGFSDWKV